MGSPELPEDSDSNNSLRPQPGTVIPTYMQSTTSDESDNENRDDAYSGYQPLTLTGNTGAFYEAMDLSDDEENEENNEIVMEGGAEGGFTEDYQQIEEEKTISLEAEIHSEIWNAPRPNELNIELDSNKTEQIMSVMAGIKLPTTAIPEWAQGIPEEKWKEDLLEKIRKKTI